MYGGSELEKGTNLTTTVVKVSVDAKCHGCTDEEIIRNTGTTGGGKVINTAFDSAITEGDVCSCNKEKSEVTRKETAEITVISVEKHGVKVEAPADNKHDLPVAVEDSDAAMSVKAVRVTYGPMLDTMAIGGGSDVNPSNVHGSLSATPGMGTSNAYIADEHTKEEDPHNLVSTAYGTPKVVAKQKN